MPRKAPWRIRTRRFSKECSRRRFLGGVYRLRVHRTAESGQWRPALLAGLFVWLQFLASIYYGVFLSLTLLVIRGMPLPTEGDLNSDALTAYSWGYWGWGNSVPQFLQAATALESARGFQSPAFADIRLRRSVRAPGFNGKALERLVGSSRYRWFKGLGNAHIATGKSGVRIADPPQAHALLDLVKEQAADGRRVLFFCACKVGHPCHRRRVATLLLSAARVRRVDLTVIEWPGGDPEIRELRLKTERESRASGKTIPLGQRMPSDGSATLPWGSTVMVRRGDEVQQVLTGPAIFTDQWRLPRLNGSGPGVSDEATPAAQARRLRAVWRCGPRRSSGTSRRLSH